MLYSCLNPNSFSVSEIQLIDNTSRIADEFGVKSGEWYQQTFEKEYTWFVLWKRWLTTSEAIARIARFLGISRRRISCAGNKDRRAETTQFCSVYKIPPSDLMAVNIPNVRIIHAFESDIPVKLGGLLGNKFSVDLELLLNACKGKDTQEINDVPQLSIKEVGRKITSMQRVPNYFGEQRFGSVSSNTHLVGLDIMKGRLEDAVNKIILGSASLISNDAEVKDQIKELLEVQNYPKLYDIIPPSLRFERQMVAHLSEHPNDFANALRRLPKTLLLMYIHAVQSALFNEMLFERIKEGNVNREDGEYYCGERYGFPDITKSSDSRGWLVSKIIGYNTELNNRELTLLDRHGIFQDDFRVRRIPEVSSKGGYRLFFTPVIDPSFLDNNISFILPSGSYATVVLREGFSMRPFIVEKWGEHL